MSLIQSKGEKDIMKNIRQRVDGRWEWRKMTNGVRQAIIKPTQRELIAALRRLKQDKYIYASSNSVRRYTLIDWCYYWADTYKNNNRIKARTINEIKRYFKNHIDNTEIAKIYINSLTTDMLQNFFNKMKPSRTKELVILYVKAALKKAKGLNLIKQDLFEEFVADAKQSNIDPPFTYDEQVRILEALKGKPIEHVIMFYLLTGVRKNERPQTKDELLKALDCENNLLKIKCEKKRFNKTVYRYIDLSPAATKYIESHANKICKLSSGQVYKQFMKLLNTLNIKGKLHTLRHTFTTNHWYLGNPDKLISSWLGHETVDLTQKVYIFIDRTIKKEKILNLYGELYYLFK